MTLPNTVRKKLTTGMINWYQTTLSNATIPCPSVTKRFFISTNDVALKKMSNAIIIAMISTNRTNETPLFLFEFFCMI